MRNLIEKLDELYQSLIISRKKLKSDSLLFIRQKNCGNKALALSLILNKGNYYIKIVRLIS